MMDDQMNRSFGLPPTKRPNIESTSSETSDVRSQMLDLPDELSDEGNSSRLPNAYMGASSTSYSLDSLDHLQPPPSGAQIPNPVLDSTPSASLNSSHGQHTPGSGGGFAPSPHSGMGRSPHMLGSNTANSPSTNVVSTSADPTPALPTVSSSPAHSISSIPPSFSPGPPSGVRSVAAPGLQLPPQHGMQRMIANHIATTTPPNPNLVPGAGGSHLPPYSRSSHHMGGPIGGSYVGQNPNLTMGMRPSYSHKPNMYNNPMSRNQQISMFPGPGEYSVSRPHLQPNMIGMDHFRGQIAVVGPPSLSPGEIGAANDMQPGQQPRLQNPSGSSSTASNDPEKRKLIQQQLVLLLHAHRCQQREREQQANGGDFRPCTLPHCKTMKNVLNHMTECQAGRECTFAHCASSRQIIFHWKNCTQQDCPVCLPLKNAALQRPSNSAPGFVPNPIPRPEMLSQPGISGSYPKPFPDEYNLGGSVRGPINPDCGLGYDVSSSTLPRGHPGNLVPFGSPQTHPQYPGRPGMPGGGMYAKEWQREIDNDLRLHLIKKLVEAIYPGHQVSDPRIESLKHYAVNVEKAFFESANSREEYYQLLAERIYRIRKELDERRKLKKAQSAVPQAPGPGSVANGSVDPNKMPNLDEASISNRESMPPTPNTNSNAQQQFATGGSSALSPFPAFPLSNTLPPTPYSGHENKEKEKVLQSLLSSMPATCSSQQQPMSSSIQPPVSSSIQAPLSSNKDISYPAISVSTSSQPTPVSMATAAQVPPIEPKKEPMLSPTLASVSALAPAPDKAMPSAGTIMKSEPMESSLDSIPSKPVSTPQPLSSVPSVKYSGSVPAHRESTSEPFPPTPQGTPLSVKDKGVSPQQPMIKPDPALVKIFTKEELETALVPVLHLVSSQDPESFPFQKPVDPKYLGIPDYFEIVKQPIDLSCIKLKLMRGDYSNPWEFCEDIWLMFDNAWLYNKKTSRVYKYCTKLAEVFDDAIDRAMQNLGYCCGQRHVFHPQVLYCYGKPLCTIPRDSPYFGYQNRYVYCPKCFSELPGSTVSVGDDDKAPKVIPKSEFVEMKNDAVDREPFIECVHCKRKMHKICVLHHDSIWPEGFQCDSCLRHKKIGRKESKYNAKRLPTTKLGNYLQERVNNYLRSAGADAGEVTIRVVSSSDKVLDTRPGMRDRFTGEFPAQFPYRTKALFVFEEIDGVEVCFFGMHVQEYGSDCPAPNNRRVYISYLDSVHFFRPKQYRTLVYHEILVGYLEFVKMNGFQTAHIWACPPGEGDDYIFHCHPVEQKIPKPKRLVEWYRRMLESGKHQRVVYDFKDIFRHCTDEGITTVTEIPYFEGDFWPNVIEETIKELDQEEEERKASEAAASGERGGGPKKAGKRNNNKKGSKKASGNRAKSSKKPGLVIGGDDLSQKIYQTMEKHKEVFFIVLLQPPSHSSPLPATTDPDSLIACDLMDGRDALLNLAREKHWEFSSLRRAKYSTMALLYELHTQSNDRFIYTCNNCHTDIETRYHCTQCEDYDLCERCYAQVNHEHEMKKSDGSDTDLQAPQPTAQARSDQLRKRVEFLLHAIRCRDIACHQPLCIRMKQLLRHIRDCRLRSSGNCVACKHYILLCATHARECKETNCHVPGCANIKQRLRSQREQQQRQTYQHVQRRWHRMNATMSASATSGSSPTNSEDKEKQADPSPSTPRPSAVPTPGKGGGVPSPLTNPRSVGKAGPKTPVEIHTPKPTPATTAAAPVTATPAVTAAQPIAAPTNSTLISNSQPQLQNPATSYYPNTHPVVAPQPRPQLHPVQPQIHPNQAAHNPYMQHMSSQMSPYGGYKPHHQNPMVNQGSMMNRPVPMGQHPQMRYPGSYTSSVQHMNAQMYQQMPQQVPPGMMGQVFPSRANPVGVAGPMTTGPSQSGLLQILHGQPQQVGTHLPEPRYAATQSIGPPPQYMRPRLSMQHQAQAAQAYAQQQQMMSQQVPVAQMAPQTMRHMNIPSQHMNPVAMQRPIMQHQQYMHGRPQMDPSLTADPSMYHQNPFGHSS